MIKLVNIIGWPAQARSSTRNKYQVSPLLVACVILQGMSSPGRWADMEDSFGKHVSQLSEIFWEGIEYFLDARTHLVLGAISQDFITRRVISYSSAIYEKSGALRNCVGFIDGAVFGIAPPKGNIAQRVGYNELQRTTTDYNGLKRKHSLKFQALNSPYGLVLHL